jgi:hypothetical protein
MSDLCQRVHEIVESTPLLRFPFDLESLPPETIYFMNEHGEAWGHGGVKPRIVQIGTQRNGNFSARLIEHFALNERMMDFDDECSIPKDRSILRKTIGRALLARVGDPYIEVWNRDFTTKAERDRSRRERDITKEKELELEITNLLREHFSLRYLTVPDEEHRMGKTSITRRLIATIAQCGCCVASPSWLGRNSPSQAIAHSGLWQVQYTSGAVISESDFDYLEGLIPPSRLME